MIAYKISFFEEDDLPDNPQPFMIYLILRNGVANSYVTDKQGQVKPMGNVPLIQQVAGDLAIVPGDGKTMRQILKQQILTDR